MQKTSSFVIPPHKNQECHLNPGVLELELRPAVHAYFWVMPTGSFALGARSMIYIVLFLDPARLRVTSAGRLTRDLAR